MFSALLFFIVYSPDCCRLSFDHRLDQGKRI